MSEPARTPAQVVQALLDGVGSGQWAALSGLYAVDTIVEHPFAQDQSRLLEGRAALVDHFERLRSSGDRLLPRDLVIHQTTDPELVVSELVYDGVRSDSSTYEMAACFVWHIVDGQIRRAHDYLGPQIPTRKA
jgi:uncharacterized protein